MSDNSNNWATCMSWDDYRGQYRRGTIAMLNSPYAIVAYLKSDKPYLIDGNEWNNKKYRQLILVTDHFITNARSYPYQSVALDKEILKAVSNLLGNPFPRSTTFNKNNPLNHKNFFYSGEVMYNDFCSHTHQFFYDDTPLPDHFNYAGIDECVICGATGESTSFADESFLFCRNCMEETEIPFCCSCQSTTLLTEVDGRWYCQDCLCDQCTADSYTGEWHNTKDMETIYFYDSTIEDYITDSSGDLVACAIVYNIPAMLKPHIHYIPISKWSSIAVCDADLPEFELNYESKAILPEAPLIF